MVARYTHKHTEKTTLYSTRNVLWCIEQKHKVKKQKTKVQKGIYIYNYHISHALSRNSVFNISRYLNLEIKVEFRVTGLNLHMEEEKNGCMDGQTIK